LLPRSFTPALFVKINSTPLSANQHLLNWIKKMAELTKPAAIHWVDGSIEEYEGLCAELVAAGTFTKLNEKLWPGCYLARSDPGDVARSRNVQGERFFNLGLRVALVPEIDKIEKKGAHREPVSPNRRPSRIRRKEAA
jgi:hypothetical protein